MRAVAAAFGFLVVASFGNAGANTPEKERPFEDNVDQADIVIVGKVITGPHELEVGGPSRFVTVEVSLPLKGAPEARIEFMSETGIAEMDPRCCDEGRSYLLMLKHLGDRRYISVNGPFGVRKLP